MVEPLEETRAQLTFATEPLISSLAGTLKSARAGGVLEGVDLDEVEVKAAIQLSSRL
jgi:SCY1-like protein 2